MGRGASKTILEEGGPADSLHENSRVGRRAKRYRLGRGEAGSQRPAGGCGAVPRVSGCLSLLPSCAEEKAVISLGAAGAAEPESTELGARRRMEHPAGLPAAPAAPRPIHLPLHSSHRDLCKTEARSCQSRLSLLDVPPLYRSPRKSFTVDRASPTGSPPGPHTELPSTRKVCCRPLMQAASSSLRSKHFPPKLGAAVRACELSFRDAGVGGASVQGQPPLLQNEFEAS